jgi:hypothetical protein
MRQIVRTRDARQSAHQRGGSSSAGGELEETTT